MAKIEIDKCRVGKIEREGLTKEGMPYKAFTVAEGVKQKNGTYENLYYNCFAQGDIAKIIEIGADIMINGSLTPNNYIGKDGKKRYGQTLYCKEIAHYSFKKKDQNAPMEEVAKPVDTQAEELPFD